MSPHFIVNFLQRRWQGKECHQESQMKSQFSSDFVNPLFQISVLEIQLFHLTFTNFQISLQSCPNLTFKGNFLTSKRTSFMNSPSRTAGNHPGKTRLEELYTCLIQPHMVHGHRNSHWENLILSPYFYLYFFVWILL